MINELYIQDTTLEEVNPSLFKNYTGKTDEEIKDILSCRERLTLTGKRKKFSGDDLLGENFKSYIKGENKGADTSRPRSVKSIEIKSSNLKRLESAVIYDVPGFDSPTKIHLRQTEERLKKADAIILVTNAGRNPSLQGTTLSVINKNTDEDGIPLKDKLFVFGNQIDTANNPSEADGNKRVLVKDVLKYKIGEEKRVFVGSALKYLVDSGVVEKEYKSSFDVNAGIDEIRKELVFYYENERFEILKRKVDLNSKNLKKLFADVLSVSRDDLDEDFSEREKFRIIRGAYKSIEKNLEDDLNEFKFNLKHEVWDDRYFSRKFEAGVDDFDCFQEIDEVFVNKVKMDQDDSLTTDIPVEKINQQIRRVLHKKYLEEFSGLIDQMTGEKSREIEGRLLQVFSLAVSGGGDSFLFDEIKEDSVQFIEKLTASVAHNESRFTYLIEHFSRDIFDVLISYPVLSEDRRGKFKKSYKEIMYLNGFYDDESDDLLSVVLGGGGRKKSDIVNHRDLVELIDFAKTIGSLTPNSMAWSSAHRSLKMVADRMDGFFVESDSMSDSEVQRAIKGVIPIALENSA